MDKVYENAREALADIGDGAVIMSGGFGLCGNPENGIQELARRGVRNLTIISNNCGTTDKGLGVLLAGGQVAKMISSYVGENKIFEKQFLSGELEVELNPQGTLAERIRAGGAGIPAFFTATGAGTMVAEGKETRHLHPPRHAARCNQDDPSAAEREFVMETGLYADLALVKARKGDEFGNLIYRKTARNFNPMMATAAAFVVAEVEELVPTGDLDADQIHTPGCFVDRIVRTESERRIEQRTTRA
jgi:3-oxoacid CoA-transferase subunit A